MSEGAADDALVRKVEAFAQDLSDLIAAVVAGNVEPFRARIAEGRDPHVIVDQSPREGLLLAVDAEPLLRLGASFRCTWDSAGEFLAVRQSTIEVRVVSADEPLFRYDYVADSDGKVPAAHLNVHGHRDELVFAMMGAGRRYRGKTRTSSMLRGKVPRLATFHFPVGGHRFRPSLEDVLETVVREFGIDTKPDWEDAVHRGRRNWRELQLRSAVRDDPQAAADVLRRLGYSVAAPAAGHPDRRDARLLAL